MPPTLALSVERTPLEDKLLVSGLAEDARSRLPEAAGSSEPPLRLLCAVPSLVLRSSRTLSSK